MKYEFTGETKIFRGIEMKRIKRISDDLIGGWIERESNLSQEGDCFIYENAIVYGNAKVYGNAIVCEDAIVYGNAKVCGKAKVYGNARVYEDARVCEDVILDTEYRKYECYKANCSRSVTAITTNDGKVLFNVGCQSLITKEEFIKRIYEKDGGLEKNSHREFYLKILSLY